MFFESFSACVYDSLFVSIPPHYCGTTLQQQPLPNCLLPNSNMTGLAEVLKCAIPVIQAPMAGILTVKMAAEVTTAGALGSLPFGSHNLSKSIALIQKTVAEYKSLIDVEAEQVKGDRLRVNLNFFYHDIYKPPTEKQQQTWFDAYKDYQPNKDKVSFANGNVLFKELEENTLLLCDFYEWLQEEKPAMLSFHFGCPPKEVISQLQRTSVVMVTVTNIDEAYEAFGVGVDGVVVQGWEAGGHRGTFMSELEKRQLTWELFTLVKPVFKDRYVVPAGGIVTVDDVQRFIDAGADMVQMGTAFLLCPELNSNAYIRTQLDRRLPTQMVSFISGKPARCVATPFIENLQVRLGNLDVPYGYMYLAYKLWVGDVKNPEYAFYLAGDKWRLAENGVPAADIAKKFSHIDVKKETANRKRNYEDVAQSLEDLRNQKDN